MSRPVSRPALRPDNRASQRAAERAVDQVRHHGRPTCAVCGRPARQSALGEWQAVCSGTCRELLRHRRLADQRQGQPRPEADHA